MMQGGPQMELGNQIKKYRNQLNMSQDELAEKIYVTRQTISNWENEKNYPDVHSLLRLSSLFEVSVDELIKGDLEMMKETINGQSYSEEDVKRFNRDGAVLTILFVAVIVLPVPLAVFGKWIGIACYAVIAGVALIWAKRIEEQKKRFDIQTYKEIVAFTEGKKLDEIEKTKEVAKRSYQKGLLVLMSGVITLVVSFLMGGLVLLIRWKFQLW